MAVKTEPGLQTRSHNHNHWLCQWFSLCIKNSAQVIDDTKGVTLAAASSLEKDFGMYGGNKEAAKKVGALVAERAKAAGVTKVVFDRGGNIYHGRVQELADGAREGGLEF